MGRFFDTYTDGIAVLHRGRLVYERYLGALRRITPCVLSITEVVRRDAGSHLVREGVLTGPERSCTIYRKWPAPPTRTPPGRRPDMVSALPIRTLFRSRGRHLGLWRAGGLRRRRRAIEGPPVFTSSRSRFARKEHGQALPIRPSTPRCSAG